MYELALKWYLTWMKVLGLGYFEIEEMPLKVLLDMTIISVGDVQRTVTIEEVI